MQRPGFVGYTADVLNVATYSAPLGVMGTVLRTRSVATMPLPLSIGTFGCSAAWTSYAVYVADATVLVPNAIGVVLSLAQLALYARFAGGDRTPVPEAGLLEQGDGLGVAPLDGGREQVHVPLTRADALVEAAAGAGGGAGERVADRL